MRPYESHGMSNSPEYLIWRSMISRCHDSNTKSYERYGERGIHVCDEWRVSFMAFYEAVGPRPTPDHTLDRLENDLGYQPGNVKWRTWIEQQNNRSNNRRLEYDGRQVTLAELSRMSGLDHKTIAGRLDRGDSIDAALRSPDRRKRFVYNGKDYTVEELAQLSGVEFRLLHGRLFSNKMSVEEALRSPQPEDTKKYYEYNGRRMILDEWAAEFGLNVGTLRSRIVKHGWSIERALNEPTHSEKRNKT